MDSGAQFVVYATLPYLGAYAGARLALARGAHDIRAGRVTAVLVAVVAIPSVIGLLVPAVLHALERNASRIEHDELWRLVTSLVQQDGGIAGTVANLFALLIVGSVAEHLLGGRQTAAVFFGVGILAQLPALAWQPIGAGNSVANFGLAGAVAMRVLQDGQRPRAGTVAGRVVIVQRDGLADRSTRRRGTQGALPLPAGALAVLAPGPAAGPALAILELLLGPADAAFSGRLLFRVLHPADELVARQGRDVLPGIECCRVGDQRLAQVCG